MYVKNNSKFLQRNNEDFSGLLINIKFQVVVKANYLNRHLLEARSIKKNLYRFLQQNCFETDQSKSQPQAFAAELIKVEQRGEIKCSNN